MAKPNKSLPTKTVKVICQTCNFILFKYKKGGKGGLLKCYKERIVQDNTQTACQCPNCNAIFAREALVHGTPAYKIIGNKAFCK